MFGIAGRFPLAAAPAAVLVAAALIWTVPTAIAHADAPLVYPGMRINQGTQSCTLGFVDPGARIGLTAGHCALDSDGPVYDDSGNRVGTADIAHFEPTPQDKSFAEQPPSTTRALPLRGHTNQQRASQRPCPGIQPKNRAGNRHAGMP